MTSKLEQLKRFTTVVADTGDLDAIARLQPVDATTNPSLLLKAATFPRYAQMMAQIQQDFRGNPQAACEQFAVAVGSEILSLIMDVSQPKSMPASPLTNKRPTSMPCV